MTIGTDVLLVPGGIGMFLLGMMLMTRGLRNLAGDHLRHILEKYTNTPAQGAVSGAITTALIQSSSATTVTAIGFVGAGLMTFPQGLGIVFGANIGTTMTGWLVAILGFKLDLGLLAQILLLIGVLLHMFTNGKSRDFGLALAGFSLLFVGIDVLQDGMTQFKGIVTPNTFPQDSYWGRFQLVLIGVAITLVTQSSSAGVATALVALTAGTISLPQAAALVIGMDVGTTFTAFLATIGGSVAMRRTGYAHVIYNLLTGLLAFFLLDAYVAALGLNITGAATQNIQLTLVGFHTSFNVIGVLLVLPMAHFFARLIMRIVPDTEKSRVEQLDVKLYTDPSTALAAACLTLADLTHALSATIQTRLSHKTHSEQTVFPPEHLNDDINTLKRYILQIPVAHDSDMQRERYETLIHAVDHLQRLSHRTTQKKRILALEKDAQLSELRNRFATILRQMETPPTSNAAIAEFSALHQMLMDSEAQFRDRIVDMTASRDLSPDLTIDLLDAMRWLRRVCYHLLRVHSHLTLIPEAGYSHADKPNKKAAH